MKRNQYVLGVGVFVLLASALGCGSSVSRGASGTGKPEPIDSDLLALVPEGAQAVLWMDLVAFRSSQLYFLLEELLGEDFTVIEELKPLDPLRKGDELVVALRGAGGGQEEQFLALLKGKVTRAEVLSSFAETEGAVSEQLGSFASIRTPEMVVVILTDQTIAIGSHSVIAQVVGLAEKTGVSLRERDGFRDFALGTGEAARLVYRRGSVVPHLEQYGAGRPPIDFDAIASGGGVLELDKGLDLKLNMNVETQMDAASMAAELTGLKKDLRRNMFVLFLGIDWMLDRISIETGKTSLGLSLNLDINDLKNLMQLASRLRKIRELAGSDDGGSGMPFQLPTPGGGGRQ